MSAKGGKRTLQVGKLLPVTGDSLEVHFINERELVIWPGGHLDEPKVLINGEPAEGRNWTFKHK